MPLTKQYESLVREWEAQLEDLEATVFAALKEAYPSGRTRRQLIWDVYHELIPNTVDLNNNPMDRKIRKTIEKLRDENLIPIVSSSSEPGYRLDMSEEAIVEMIDEWARREQVYHEKVMRGNVMQRKIREMGDMAPTEIVLPEKVTQLSFMESRNG